MPQSLVKNYILINFSTKHRNDFIDEKIETELFAYISALCKDLESPALQIGGTDNHIHILCLLSRKIAMMKFVQEIKAVSSKWMKTKGRKYEDFFWQEGYGAFSISPNNIFPVIQYIKNQREHHKEYDFKYEMINYYKKYKVNYDEKYIWD
ncbi:IS200/IS605 family transposase [Chryseobacterium chendengshani]|uniref:IS200/IS605 family transposase n=1 Tax=Chryseobacterium sp. LJ756 TaxID=2864113 RepID=UPI001C63BDF8|nr:IS200/IS605 family transposase [Chryseobacterium sp. LJ756]MBW7673987.1 IS200/IS605 family transposase [Chryseobacterium sp. LJ756]